MYVSLKDRPSLQIKYVDISSEEMLYNDEKVVLSTGLPNFKILKELFDHVVKTMPVEGTDKLVSAIYLLLDENVTKLSWTIFGVPV